jgi:hypothetical protein
MFASCEQINTESRALLDLPQMGRQNRHDGTCGDARLLTGARERSLRFRMPRRCARRDAPARMNRFPHKTVGQVPSSAISENFGLVQIDCRQPRVENRSKKGSFRGAFPKLTNLLSATTRGLFCRPEKISSSRDPAWGLSLTRKVRLRPRVDAPNSPNLWFSGGLELTAWVGRHPACDPVDGHTLGSNEPPTHPRRARDLTQLRSVHKRRSGKLNSLPQSMPPIRKSPWVTQFSQASVDRTPKRAIFDSSPSLKTSKRYTSVISVITKPSAPAVSPAGHLRGSDIEQTVRSSLVQIFAQAQAIAEKEVH